MRPYTTVTLALLLAMLVVSVRSLPLNTQESEEISSRSSSESDEKDEQLEQLKQQSDESEASSNESSNTAEEPPAPDSVEEHEEEPVVKVSKRSPDIPDPEPCRDYEKKDDLLDAPRVHPTHDEYLEWKLRQPRFRRNTDYDTLNEDYRDVQSSVENSLEEYAQGCEVMEENSDENNETTYNDYRRKREASVNEDKEQHDESAAAIQTGNTKAEDSSVESSNEELPVADDDTVADEHTSIENSEELDSQSAIANDNDESSLVSAESNESN